MDQSKIRSISSITIIEMTVFFIINIFTNKRMLFYEYMNIKAKKIMPTGNYTGISRGNRVIWSYGIIS